MTTTIPPWVSYPSEEWQCTSPRRAGLSGDESNRFVGRLSVRGASLGGESHKGDL